MLTHGELRKALLGQGEVHVDRIKGLELDDRVAAFEVLPDIDLADPQISSEGSPDRFSGNGGPDFIDGGLGGLELGLRLLVGILGDDVLRAEVRVAGEIVARQFQTGLGRVQLSILLPGVKADKGLSVGGARARFEEDFRHRSGKIRRQHHSLR